MAVATPMMAGRMYCWSRLGKARTFVTSGIWKVHSRCRLSTICALPRAGFCVCTLPPSAMLLATMTPGIGTLTVSPVWASEAS